MILKLPAAFFTLLLLHGVTSESDNGNEINGNGNNGNENGNGNNGNGNNGNENGNGNNGGNGNNEQGNYPYSRYCSGANLILPRNCLDLLCGGYNIDGIYRVYPAGSKLFSLNAVCDQTTDGGGWLVFQRRMDGNYRFSRNWSNYKFGFGNLQNEFWLGNNLINILSTAVPHTLRIDLEDFSSVRKYAQYSEFAVAGESDFFQLTATGFSGNTGNSLATHNGQKFSTFDRDNDNNSASCSRDYGGAWWYNDCLASNLNGVYYFGPSTANNATFWQAWQGNTSLKTVEMKMRPVI